MQINERTVGDITEGEHDVLLFLLDILEAVHVEHPPGGRQTGRGDVAYGQDASPGKRGEADSSSLAGAAAAQRSCR